MDERPPEKPKDLPRLHHEFLDDVLEHEARKRMNESR